MARKRKSLAAATPQVAEPVQPIQSEPEPEKPQPEKTQEILEEKPLIENKLVAAVAEEPAVEDEVVADVEEEEPRVEDEVIGDAEEEEEEGGDGVEEETKNDAVLADSIKNEQQSGTTDKAASVNGDEDEEEDEDEEDDDEEDEEEVEEEPVEKLLEPFSKDQLTLIIKEALAKHPDIAENVHKLADADPSHRKIFVHGLGWEASTDTITSVFGKYGEIEDCKVVKDKISGKSKGYGFILFKHRVGARRALKQPQKLIEGRMTSSQLASAGPVRTASPAVAAAAGTASTPPLSEYTQRKIYVSNVSAELDPKKLMEFFAKFGEIEEGPLGLDKQTGKPRGFCLFVYKSAKSASKALEEPHKNFEGQMLHCQKAVDGPKHSKGFFNQQQSQPNQQHQEGGNQGYYGHTAKKGRYSGSSEGVGHTGGHLMAPSGGGSAMPPMGFNPAVAPAAIGQAVAALLASQGAGLGIGNFLGGMGGGANHPMMNNPAYGGQGGGGYGGQPGMQGGYGGQPQMGRGGVRPPRGGGAPYMGRGR